MAFLLRFLPQISGALSVALLLSLSSNYALWNKLKRTEAEAAADLADYKEQIASNDQKIAVAAAEAQQAAINLQNERWQKLLLKSQESAREAQRNRQAAEEEARLLRMELENAYENDPDAQDWRDIRIPDSLRGVLEDEDHPT